MMKSDFKMFYVKQNYHYLEISDLNNIFTTIDLRYKLKVNDTFRLINMDEKGYCVWYINF